MYTHDCVLKNFRNVKTRAAPRVTSCVQVTYYEQLIENIEQSNYVCKCNPPYLGESVTYRNTLFFDKFTSVMHNM